MCACIALRGTLLEKTSCSVYDKRPEVCRNAVKPGDKICRDIRAFYRANLERLAQ